MNNLTELDIKLLKEKYGNLDLVIDKINNNYPVQYLIGNVDFYGYNINVTEDTLIPRFETETLVEKSINLINKYDLNNKRMLEVGTGTGCISIVLKDKIKSLDIDALDISDKALAVAKNNALNNKVDINFINEDIFKYKPINKYDILISNPPYIAYDEVIDSKCDYEPSIALYADNEGMKFYEYIIDNYNTLMNDKFIMCFEIGYSQGDKLINYAKEKIPSANIYVEKDLSGKDRYLFIINE